MKCKRQYQQHCGLARALDVLGERWTLLVVRELLLGARRFSDLLGGLPGISTNLLTQRLKEMATNGLIEKGGDGRYRLTPAGEELEPVLLEIGRWGGRFMQTPPGPEDAVNVGWALIALKRRYRGGARGQLELTVEERTFELTFTPVRLVVRERHASAPEGRLITDRHGFFDIFYRGLEVEGRARGEGAWRELLHNLS